MRALWFLLLATACPAAVGAATTEWSMTEASGPVQVLRQGVAKIATRGTVLGAGDVVKTGAGGRAVIARGEEYLMVAPGSQVRVPQVEQPGALTRFIEDFGNVVFMIKKKAAPHFAVQTPYLAAVVKGTTFSVAVTDTGASVKVLEGAVDVATTDGGAHELVTPGAVALVDAASLGRMRVRANGIERIIDSPKPAVVPDAAPAGRPRSAAATSAEETPAAAPPASVEATSPPGAVLATVYEEPVSLAETTAGLVTGELGAPVSAVAVAPTNEGTPATVIPVAVAVAAITTPEPATVALASLSQASRTANEAVRSVVAGIQTASAAVSAQVAQQSAASTASAVSAEANRVAAMRIAAEAATQQAAASAAASAAAARAGERRAGRRQRGQRQRRQCGGSSATGRGGCRRRRFSRGERAGDACRRAGRRRCGSPGRRPTRGGGRGVVRSDRRRRRARRRRSGKRGGETGGRRDRAGPGGQGREGCRQGACRDAGRCGRDRSRQGRKWRRCGCGGESGARCRPRGGRGIKGGGAPGRGHRPRQRECCPRCRQNG